MLAAGLRSSLCSPEPNSVAKLTLFCLSIAKTLHKKKYTRDKVSLDLEPRSSASGPRPPPPAGGPSRGSGCSRGDLGGSRRGLGRGGKAPSSQSRSRSPAAPGSSSGLRCGQREPCPTSPRLLGREIRHFIYLFIYLLSL